MALKMVRQRAEKMAQETGFMPVSVRMVKGTEDAACLDRMTEVYGSRSDALRAGLHALENGRSYAAGVTAALRIVAERVGSLRSHQMGAVGLLEEIEDSLKQLLQPEPAAPRKAARRWQPAGEQN